MKRILSLAMLFASSSIVGWIQDYPEQWQTKDAPMNIPREGTKFPAEAYEIPGEHLAPTQEFEQNMEYSQERRVMPYRQVRYTNISRPSRTVYEYENDPYEMPDIE